MPKYGKVFQVLLQLVVARERSERSRTNAEREKERKIYPVPD